MARRNAGRPHACAPDHQLGGNDLSVRELDALGQHFGDARAGAHLHAELQEEVPRRIGDAGRQSGEYAVGRLDQYDPQVALGIYLVEPVGDDLAGGVVQFAGELGAGRARPDDRDVQLGGTYRLVLILRSQKGVHQPAIEAARLFRRIQRNGELRRAGRAEIIGDAADGDDQRVVGEAGSRNDLAPVLVLEGRQRDRLGGAIEADHLAVAIAKMAPVSLREIVQLVLRALQAAGRDGMKQRLPDMGPAAVDQSDSGAARLAETFAQPGREFEPAGASADDDDMMRREIRHAGFTRSREAYGGDRPLAESKQEVRPRAARRPRSAVRRQSCIKTQRRVSKGGTRRSWRTLRT